MAVILRTPSIIPFPPFNPQDPYIIEYSFNGNQPVKNRVVITDNRTGTVVYDQVQETMKLQHEIPADVLNAGRQYLMRLQVFDSDGNSSSLSDAVLFYCFRTPSFYFSDITDNQIYKNASITLNINYFQSEDEKLKSVQFLEYSSDKALLSKSDTFYTLSSHSFYGLKNNSIYYFRAIGETVHGISLDTGYVKVNIAYQTFPANIIFKAENNYCEGYIKLTSGIMDVQYEFKNDNYTLKNGLLTLTDNWLKYFNSFHVSGDFILFVEAKKLPLQRFLTTNEEEFSLSIVNVCESYYCRLTVKDSNLSMFAALPKARISTESDDLLITEDGNTVEIVNTSYDDDDLVVFEVRRIGWHYSLKSYYRSEIENENKEEV